jgi:hypothetical protein
VVRTSLLSTDERLDSLLHIRTHPGRPMDLMSQAGREVYLAIADRGVMALPVVAG